MNAKELRLLMPQNADDVDAARKLVSLGPEQLRPVVPDMLRRLKDTKAHGISSPVVYVYCEFFAMHGEIFVDEIGHVLARSSMEDLKNIIVTKILAHWFRDSLAKLSGILQMLVTHTNFFNTDLALITLLHKHNLADIKWLSEWLEFKRDRLARLSSEADDIASKLGIIKN